MPEQNENKELIQLSDDFLEQVTILREKGYINIKIDPNYLISNDGQACWNVGYMAGYKKAIEDLKIKI